MIIKLGDLGNSRTGEFKLVKPSSASESYTEDTRSNFDGDESIDDFEGVEDS
jgi:hypothetical protein